MAPAAPSPSRSSRRPSSWSASSTRSRTPPNWPEVKASFFNWDVYKSSFPGIARAFLLNVKIFMIAEAIILFTALGLDDPRIEDHGLVAAPGVVFEVAVPAARWWDDIVHT